MQARRFSPELRAGNGYVLQGFSVLTPGKSSVFLPVQRRAGRWHALMVLHGPWRAFQTHEAMLPRPGAGL